MLISGLVPIGVTIALGWGLRRSGLVREDLWPGINKLAYVALLPSLLFITIATADLEGLAAGKFISAATLAFVSMAVLAVLIKPFLPGNDPDFTSVFQGGLRWNGFVILALAQTSFTAEQAALVALTFAPTVPIINILSVAALTIWGTTSKSPQWKDIGWRIITNPLIIACIAGIVVMSSPGELPKFIIDTAELIGRSALPLILLTVGAGLNFAAIRNSPGLLSVAVILKLLIAPAIFLGFGIAFGLPPEVIMVLVAIGGAPGAVSSYVLAQQLGGNAELTAAHVTVTTLLAFITLPLILTLAS